MDEQLVQAIVLGIVQGLTEFLPVSSSGHLIIVPALLGWDDPFIESLAFSVMLHVATLLALLIYFRSDWLRLIPAGLAALRDRSFRGDPDRKLAWLLAATTVPAVIVGVLLNDLIETAFREARLVAITLVIGAVVLWLADRLGSRTRPMAGLTFPIALGIGAAQALALVPGISRSGISISAGLFAGLDREAAARFAFLMATPITAGAGLWELRKIVDGRGGRRPAPRPARRRDGRVAPRGPARHRRAAALSPLTRRRDLRRLPDRTRGAHRRGVARPVGSLTP